MSHPVIKFEDVWKYYPLYFHLSGGVKDFFFNFPHVLRKMRNNKFLALKSLSFEVRQGEALGIVGLNGTGKSTLLGLIAGVIKPTSGTMTVSGRISPLLELGAGFYPDLSGKENVVLNGVLLGLTRRTVLKRLNDIIEFSGLGESIGQPIRTYSHGMLARLGFSIVAHLDPEILLIDEILAVGDIEFQKKCMNKIMEFKKRGVTLVLVSHNMDDIRMVCERVVWLKNQQIHMHGPSESVVSTYESAGA